MTALAGALTATVAFTFAIFPAILGWRVGEQHAPAHLVGADELTGSRIFFQLLMHSHVFHGVILAQSLQGSYEGRVYRIHSYFSYVERDATYVAFLA